MTAQKSDKDAKDNGADVKFHHRRPLITAENLSIAIAIARISGVFFVVMGVLLVFDPGGVTAFFDIDPQLDPPPQKIIGSFFIALGLAFFFAMPPVWRRYYGVEKDKAL